MKYRDKLIDKRNSNSVDYPDYLLRNVHLMRQINLNMHLTNKEIKNLAHKPKMRKTQSLIRIKVKKCKDSARKNQLSNESPFQEQKQPIKPLKLASLITTSKEQQRIVSFYQSFLSKQGDKSLKTVRSLLSDINSTYRTAKLESTQEITKPSQTSRQSLKQRILNEEQADVSEVTSTSRKATFEGKSMSARSASVCQIKPFRISSPRVKLKLPRLVDSPSELMKASMKSTFSPFTFKIESSEGGTIQHGGNPFLVGAINHALMKVKIERTRSEAEMRDSLQTRESSAMPVVSRPLTTQSLRQRMKQRLRWSCAQFPQTPVSL